MKIILDAVVNHSTEHPWFCPPLGAQSNRDSPWRSFYTFDNEGIMSAGRAFAACPSSTSPAKVQDAVYRADDAILRYWMRAPLPDRWLALTSSHAGRARHRRGNRSHVRAIRGAVKQENPDAYVLGEHFFEASQWLQGIRMAP